MLYNDNDLYPTKQPSIDEQALALFSTTLAFKATYYTQESHSNRMTYYIQCDGSCYPNYVQSMISARTFSTTNTSSAYYA